MPYSGSALAMYAALVSVISPNMISVPIERISARIVSPLYLGAGCGCLCGGRIAGARR